MRILSVAIVCLAAGFGLAETTSDQAPAVKLGAYDIWDLGYLNQGQFVNNGQREKLSFGDLIGGVVVSGKLRDNLTLLVNPELKSNYGMPNDRSASRNGERVLEARWEAYMEQSNLRWTFGDADKPKWDVQFGYQYFKENPDAKDFGEYMFRNMVYPTMLTTKMANPLAQIFGLRVGNQLGDSFHQNFFVLSEIQHYPFFDISLAYEASYKYKNILEVGAGVNFYHLIPVHPSFTTPTAMENTWITLSPQAGTLFRGSDDSDQAGLVRDTLTVTANGDSLDVTIGTATGSTTKRVASHFMADVSPELATLYNGGNLASGVKGESGHFSFAGTIPMVRASINPMGFMETNPLGKDAFKVYTEISVMGWKDYPVWYAERSQRTPIMIGIDLPTLDFLDFLSVEGEYMPNKLKPTWGLKQNKFLPLPGEDIGVSMTSKDMTVWDMESAASDARAKKNYWGWDLTAKKSFGGWSVIFQGGKDHQKWEEYVTLFGFHEFMTRPAEWYSQVRIVGSLGQL